MYEKIHKAVRQNAENQNCKKLLKLIDLADSYNLKVIYAYKKHFKAYLNNPEKVVKYIEVIDLYCRKRFNQTITIIKNENGSFISLIDTYLNQEAVSKFTPEQFKKYVNRLTIASNFLQELKKFNLDDLPIMD